jgi:hypothetical protein
MKISRQMRFVGLAVLVLVIAGVGAKMLLVKGAPMSLVVPLAVHHAARHAAVATHGHKSHQTAPRVFVDPTLPAALRLALLHHGVVIAVLYAPNAPGDEAAVEAARKGAQGAHVGFAALNVLDEAIATAVALKLPGSSDPSVAVVQRPGKITLLLNGYVDSDVVAQAARAAGA